MDAASTARVDWNESRVTGEWVVAPLASKADPFAQENRHGYRYAVVHVPSGGLAVGHVVEMVASEQPLPQAQAADRILAATKPLFTKAAPVNAANFSGWLILYPVAYEAQTSLVYKDGAVQQAQVNLSLQKAIAKPSSNSANFIDNETVCITVNTCGYVNGELSNCISYQVCYDTGGDGEGGGDGGGGWGGDGSGGGGGGVELPTGIDTPTSVQEQTPSLGDYAATLAISPNAYQVINVKVEIDRANHDLQKV